MIIMKIIFEMPKNVDEKTMDGSQWVKKQREEYIANGKGKYLVLSLILTYEINQIGAWVHKELWNKLIELHEGITNAKLARWDLSKARIDSHKTQKGTTNLYTRFKELINDLAVIGDTMSNPNMLHAINVFPRTPPWVSMVDPFYTFMNIEISSLEDLFSTIELYESRIVGIV